MKERIVECYTSREAIKSYERAMEELRKKLEERKKELLDQLSQDEVFVRLREEYERLSDIHAKEITEFSQKMDKFIDDFGKGGDEKGLKFPAEGEQCIN